MRRLRRGMLVALSALAVAPPAASAQSASAARPEVVAIHFEGNEVFPDDSLELAIVNRATSCRTFVFKWIIPLCPLGVDLAWDSHYLQPRELTNDVLRLELYYWLRGYREADADSSITRLSDDEVELHFQVDEGVPVRVDTVLFTGDSVPEPGILRRLPLRAGDPLSAIRLDATRDTLRARLRNRGFARAEIFRSFFIPSGSYEAEVEYNVYTGPRARFGEIDIRWNDPDHSLSRESVLRFLPFQEGDVYSREEILQAQRSLYGVELIQSARIEEDTTAAAPDSVVPLTVTLSEGNVHRVRAGTGWSTAECLSAESRWTSRNFLGDARRLTVRGRVSNVFAGSARGFACPDAGEDLYADVNWLASVELFQPWVFSTRNSLTLSVFGEKASLPDIFVRRAVGATAGVTRSLGPGAAATVSWRPQLSELSAAEIFFCTSFLVCEPDDIERLQQASWLSPVGASVRFDRTDHFLNPSNGYQLFVDLEHASSLTGSDFGYHRVVAEASWYDELARRTVIAARLRAGWVGQGEFIGGELEGTTDVLHPQKRFFSGGASSVRGFAQNRLGPRVLTTDVRNLLGFRRLEGGDVERVCTPVEVNSGDCDPADVDDGVFFPRPTGGTRLVEGNLEYRFAFGGEFQGVGFLDFGQVWREGESVDVGSLELSPGIGVRYFSPVGPIRVDLGYRFRGGQELEVVTQRVRPRRPGERGICVVAYGALDDQDSDCDGDRARIDWVRLDDLAVLRQPTLFGEGGGFLSRLQLHFSIGQAF